ncbi:hypothetical protein CDD81_3199 [Ophiocordyceps australis]|uniref:Uncharacterized protein n=1 Tax=Ophiocordyceps australis TaxID=1399860 RepID=A0A2C5X7C0_9HYPO|nr:hypothetical protein CDD81_3199 [Ophiocordyceps australis]
MRAGKEEEARSKSKRQPDRAAFQRARDAQAVDALRRLAIVSPSSCMEHCESFRGKLAECEAMALLGAFHPWDCSLWMTWRDKQRHGGDLGQHGASRRATCRCRARGVCTAVHAAAISKQRCCQGVAMAERVGQVQYMGVSGHQVLAAVAVVPAVLWVVLGGVMGGVMGVCRHDMMVCACNGDCPVGLPPSSAGPPRAPLLAPLAPLVAPSSLTGLARQPREPARMKRQIARILSVDIAHIQDPFLILLHHRDPVVRQLRRLPDQLPFTDGNAAALSIHWVDTAVPSMMQPGMPGSRPPPRPAPLLAGTNKGSLSFSHFSFLLLSLLHSLAHSLSLPSPFFPFTFFSQYQAHPSKLCIRIHFISRSFLPTTIHPPTLLLGRRCCSPRFTPYHLPPATLCRHACAAATNLALQSGRLSTSSADQPECAHNSPASPGQSPWLALVEPR